MTTAATPTTTSPPAVDPALGLPLDPPLRRDLERATAYHFASLLFQPPAPSLASDLAALLPALPPALRPAAEALAAAAAPDLEHAYHALLGGSGACPDCESDYEVNALGGKGPLLADVAAFYAAFRFDAPARLLLAPDHVAIELDFLGYLALKAAHARHAASDEDRAICDAAAARFVAAHLGRWAPAFLERLADLAGEGFHGQAAHWAAALLDLLDLPAAPAPGSPA